MEKTEDKNVLINISSHFTADEFREIVSLLPYVDLIKPIKKYNKKFRNETRGFRPHRLPLEKVINIYYKYVYQNRDPILNAHFRSLVEACQKAIENHVTKEIGPTSKVFEKIENNDMDCFEEFVVLLLETPFKRNVQLYFKLIDQPLTKEQESFCKNELDKFLERREMEKEIKGKILAEYEDEKSKLNKVIADKEELNKRLKKEIKEIKKRYADKLLQKEDIIWGLKNELSNVREEAFNEKNFFETEIERIKAKLKDFEEEVTRKDKDINEMRDKLSLKYDQFNKMAKEKWDIMHQDLIQERDQLRSQTASLAKERETLEKEIEQLLNKKSDLEKNVTPLEERAGDILLHIREIAQVLNDKPDSPQVEKRLFRERSIKMQEKVTIVDDFSYFIDDLTDNLEISGIHENDAYNVACYIHSIFTNKKSLLLAGYKSREISNAISYTINGASVDVVGLPLGFNDSHALVSAVKEAESKVILLENIVDNVSENVYLPLLKEQLDKFLVFSMESSESAHILEGGLFNYMMALDIDNVIGLGNEENEFHYTEIDRQVFNIHVDRSAREQNLGQINSFYGESRLLSNTIKLILADILSVMNQSAPQISIEDVLRFMGNFVSPLKGVVNEFSKEYEMM